MDQQQNSETEALDLHKQAEKILHDKRQITPLPSTVAELQQLVTDLELRSIESDLLQKKKQSRHRNHFQYQALLLNSVGQAVIATDRNGYITFWNSAAEKLYGWSAEEALGRDIMDTIALEQSKEKGAEIIASLARGESWSGEDVVRHRNGSAIPIHVFDTPVLDESGDLIGIIGVAHDISTQKQAEAQLLLSNKALADFQNAIQQVSIVSKADKHGIITYFNDKFVEISGYASEELIGQNHSIINSGYHPKEFWMDMWKTITSGKKWRGEIRNKAKDGRYYWVDTFIIPLLGNEGEVREFLSIRNDITERKHIEHELGVQHRFIRTITENLPSMVCYWTSELRCTFANAGYLQWFGRTPTEMDGITIQELLGEPLFRKNEPYIRGALRGEKQQFERTFTKGNGEEKFLWVQYIPDNTDGIVKGFVAVLLDITEIKKAQINLNHAQHLARVGSWEWDLVQNSIYWSDELYEIFGEDKHTYQPTIESYFKYLSAEVAEKVQLSLTSALNGEKPFAMEHKITRADGTARYVFEQASITFDNEQRPIQMYGTTQDITERKEAEEQIRQSEANLRAIMDSSIQAFWLTDTELRIQTFNKVTKQIVQFLFGREIVIGESILNYVLPEQREQFIASAERALAGEAVIYEESFIMQNSEEQWSELMYLPTRNAEGTIIGLTLSTVNITDRKLAYQELEKMNTTLEERVVKRTQELLLLNKEKDEFLGIAAHDLKNPLAGILSSAELMERYFPNEKTHRFTSMIINASNQMLDIITNLLDVNRIETGMLNLHFEPVNLEILDRIIEEYQSRATEKGIIVHYETLKRDTAWVHGDKQCLRQIFDNLISNAIKYSPQWKNVWIRVLSNTSGNVRTIRVEIQDEGQGLSEQDKKKLFGKFARLSAQPTGGENSTGLGLSIVKKLVEMHNGRVWCESEADKGVPGATFIVEMPSVETTTL